MDGIVHVGRVRGGGEEREIEVIKAEKRDKEKAGRWGKRVRWVRARSWEKGSRRGRGGYFLASAEIQYSDSERKNLGSSILPLSS